jgi:trimeric autotransporter adhesin
MKKTLLITTLILSFASVRAQTVYYWTGSPGDSINITSNWNTVLDGSSSTRPLNTTTTDILVFDGSNLGSGFVNVVSTASISCAQLKFVNDAKVNFSRISSGTSTITIAGDAGEDFVIESGCALTVPLTSTGSLRFAMAAANTARVSGSLTFTTPQQVRFDNTTSGTKGSFVFTNGSSFTTNITSASSSYAFGSSSQSSEGWVVFQSGSNLFFDGGYSPVGSGTNFSAIDMQPGSTWHHRASNSITGFGNFFNRKNYGDVMVENNATLTAMGSVYSIQNLTVTAGSSFVTAATGQTVLLGNLMVDGSLTSPAGSTNALVLAGTGTQSVSGSGTIDVGGLIVASNANVVLNSNINIQNSASVYGKINFNNNKISGPGTFSAKSPATLPSLTGNSLAGNYFVSAVTGFNSSYVGSAIAGTGIAPNTVVVSYSTTSDSVYLSQPTTSIATGTSFTFTSPGATLETSNINAFDAASGSVVVTGTQTYQDGISYILNSATSKPFGISTASSATHVEVSNLTFNAPVTTNSSVYVRGNLQINSGKFTIRPLDTVYLLSTATILGGSYASKYIVTDVNTTTGAQGILKMGGIIGSRILPVGTNSNYLPITLTPASASDFAVAVFEGITDNGAPNGTALSSNQKLTKVNAVWNVNRVNGSGDAGVQVQWPPGLEGTAFTTFADSVLGVIVNQNPGWSLPVGTADNAANTASATLSSFGALGVGAKPPAQPFIFNPLPAKMYGDADFDPGAISLNTSSPIVYTSSNAAVATIVNSKVHITGVGSATITASQATDGFYPSASQSQPLTVSKANLTIKADDKSKPEGDPNPTLTVTYTGFANGETSAVLSTQPSINTTATTSSPAGTYPIVVSAATAANYNITFVNGTLTVTPRQSQTITFNAPPVKTYGNADFAAGATSTNNTIPITYTSSNTSVATIVGSNIHIVGGGTTTITASQAGNAFYFPAQSVAKTLTINKANLAVKVADTVRNYGESNPPFVITYSGFVLGEIPAALTSQPTATTTATATTAPGYYPIVLSGGVSNNYNFVYANGTLTILPATGSEQPNMQAFMSGSNILTVRVFSASPDIADVILYDMTGKPVLKKNVFLPKGFITVNMSVSGLTSGLYSVVVNGQTVRLKKNVTIAR